MAKRSYIILNFLHGNGPYLRTTELALAVNDELEARGRERFGIIVPLVYGDRQRIIMKENFGSVIGKYPDELLLDARLGELIKPLLYTGEGVYENSLKYFLENQKTTQESVWKYLGAGIAANTFSGKSVSINRNEISIELNRCPQLNMGISRSYYTGFSYISKVLEHALKEGGLGIEKKLLQSCIDVYHDIEKNQTLHFIAEPATFSYLGEQPKKYPTEIATPPNTNQIHYFSHQPMREDIRNGIYVTVTGIPGLENLFQDIKQAGFRIYTHRPELIEGSHSASPDIIGHENIKFHFARSGWGAVWLSLMTETPFVARPYNTNDDLEIYFNNKCIECLGLGKVLRSGADMSELLAYHDQYKKQARAIKVKLMKKYGTLNGVQYTAKQIVNNFLEDVGGR